MEFAELAVDLWHLLRHLGQRFGGTDAGYDILALGVNQIFTIEGVFAGAGVAREADAGAGVIAHVAEDHGADVDRRPAGHRWGDLELFAVVDGALAVPRAEYGADGDFELLRGVFREGLAGVFLDDGGELIGQFGQVLCCEINILGDAHLLLHGGHGGVERLVGHA